MPLHETVAAFAAAALLALVSARFEPRLKGDLRRPGFWAALIALASLPCAASALVAETGHAGTGFVTRHGWPKPYWFDFTGELGERTTQFEPLYFAGNMLVHAAVLLAAWSAWRVVRRAAAAGSARPET
jgi:hypothetical protein